MKTLTFVLLTILSVSSYGQSQYPAGIVYGPKGAYRIDAPTGWVLDNESGRSMGLCCVLYLEGYNWRNSPVIMYLKIASPEFENMGRFIDFAIKEFKKVDPNFLHKEFQSGKTKDYEYILMDYVGGPYKSYERVFYVQMEKAVGYVVFSAQNEADFLKYSDSMLEVTDSFEYKPEYINYKE